MTEEIDRKKFNWRDLFKKTLKVWVIFTSIVGNLLILLIALTIILVGSVSAPSSSITEKTISGQGNDKIAVIKLDGVITEDELPFDPLEASATAINPRQVRNLLNQAKDDGSVKAVILRINSPGGSAVGSDVLFDLVEDFKNQTKKKVVVSMGDVAASGGYYVAAAGDKIVANQGTITGSIGVIASIYNLSGLYDKIGVKQEVYKTGAFKDLFSESRERSPEEKALIQRLLDDSLNQFVSKVAQGRGVGEEKIRSVADGRIMSGKQAKEVGLVDELGNLDKAIEIVKNLSNLKEASIIEYSSGGFLEAFLGTKLKALSLLNFFQPVLPSSKAFSIYYLLDI